mgnify:CR=1 FL=1
MIMAKIVRNRVMVNTPVMSMAVTRYSGGSIPRALLYELIESSAMKVIRLSRLADFRYLVIFMIFLILAGEGAILNGYAIDKAVNRRVVLEQSIIYLEYVKGNHRSEGRRN